MSGEEMHFEPPEHEAEVRRQEAAQEYLDDMRRPRRVDLGPEALTASESEQWPPPPRANPLFDGPTPQDPASQGEERER